MEKKIFLVLEVEKKEQIDPLDKMLQRLKDAEKNGLIRTKSRKAFS